MNEDLKQAFQQIFDDFGQDIINDKNLANIVADYYSFDRNPAVRNILKAIVSDGYATKIGQLRTSKGDPNIDLERFACEIEQSWGYGKDQVRYVLSCIASSIGIEYKIDNSNKQKKPSIIPLPQKRVLNELKTKNNPNVPVQNQLHPPTKLDALFVWKSKIKYWHIFIFFLLFSVTSGVVLGVDNLNPLYMLIVFLLFAVLWGCFSFSNFFNHLNKTLLMVIIYTTFGLGVLGGVIGGCSIKEYREERKEMEIEAKVNDMINNRDTLTLSNYIRSSELSTLRSLDKKKIEDKYDSLKYVLMGCERIVDNMNAHTRVLKSYGFSDAGLKEMYTEDFYKILSTLLDYQPSPGQSTRDYMINKLIAYINYGYGGYCYPWNSRSYSDWKRFSFVESNNALLQCPGYGSTLANEGIESFQVRLVKENDVWFIDDYIRSDGTSLKEIYTQYLNGN